METDHVAGYPILSDPDMFKTQLQTPGHNDSSLQPQSSYLSFAPPEVIDRTLLGHNDFNLMFIVRGIELL